MKTLLIKIHLLAEKIRTLFREQGITIFSILTSLSMTISTIVLATTGAFGRGRGDEGELNKWLGRLADVLKRLAGKAVEVLPAIVGSVVSALSDFSGKGVGFVAEHTWALIVFVAELIGAWLMQRVKKGYVFFSACFVKSFVLLPMLDIFSTLLKYSVSYNATYDNSWPSWGRLLETTLSTFFLIVKIFRSF